MVLCRAAAKFSCNWSKLFVAMTAAVRLGLDISHFTIAAPGVLPLKRGSASMVWNFLSVAARPTPPMVFMAMVPKSFFLASASTSCNSCLSP